MPGVSATSRFSGSAPIATLAAPPGPSGHSRPAIPARVSARCCAWRRACCGKCPRAVPYFRRSTRAVQWWFGVLRSWLHSLFLFLTSTLALPLLPASQKIADRGPSAKAASSGCGLVAKHSLQIISGSPFEPKRISPSSAATQEPQQQQKSNRELILRPHFLLLARRNADTHCPCLLWVPDGQRSPCCTHANLGIGLYSLQWHFEIHVLFGFRFHGLTSASPLPGSNVCQCSET